jgi:putative transposase
VRVTVRAPRVNDKRTDEATGQRYRFSSAILPAWARKSPQMAEVLPLLYRHGLSTSGFAPALEQFLGTSHGLSAATITRLTEQWKDDARAFADKAIKAAKAFAAGHSAKWPRRSPRSSTSTC